MADPLDIDSQIQIQPAAIGGQDLESEVGAQSETGSIAQRETHLTSQRPQLSDLQSQSLFHGVNDQGQSQEALVFEVLSHVSRCLAAFGQLTEDFCPVYRADVSSRDQSLFHPFGTSLPAKKGQERRSIEDCSRSQGSFSRRASSRRSESNSLTRSLSGATCRKSPRAFLTCSRRLTSRIDPSGSSESTTRSPSFKASCLRTAEGKTSLPRAPI